MRFGESVWSDPRPVASAERGLVALRQFSSVIGPLDVNGSALTPDQLRALHAKLGDSRGFPILPPAGPGVVPATWAVYRAESQFISPDGRTVRFDAALRIGDPGSNAARIRDEARDTSLRQAVTRALERTGSTVTSAALVLAGTFGVFALVISGQPGGVYRDILSALALGILLDAFGVRTLLVPSTVALLGRWNWWPSAYATRPSVAPRPQAAPARLGGGR